MKISVTQEYIDRGTRSNCRVCPVALALADKFCDAGEIMVVTGIRARITKDNVTIKIADLVDRVAIWIAKFDYGNKMSPIHFDIVFQSVETT